MSKAQGLSRRIASMGMAAMMRGAQMALPDNRTRVPPPPYVQQMKRRERKGWSARLERQAYNARNRRANRAARNRISYQFDEVSEHLNRMTGWQHSQWAREGRQIDRAEYWAMRPRREPVDD